MKYVLASLSAVIAVSICSAKSSAETLVDAGVAMSTQKGFHCFSAGEKKRRKGEEPVVYCYRKHKKCESYRKTFKRQLNLEVSSCTPAKSAYCFQTKHKKNGRKADYCFAVVESCRTVRAVALNTHKYHVSKCQLTR